MWALTDFTEANGATRIIPGSHTRDPSPDYGKPYDSIPAEMPRGSVLIWHGSVWHGGGANTTSERRVGIAMNYCAGFVRQQKNQQLGSRWRPSKASSRACASGWASGSTTGCWATSTSAARTRFSARGAARAWSGTRIHHRNRSKSGQLRKNAFCRKTSSPLPGSGPLPRYNTDPLPNLDAAFSPRGESRFQFGEMDPPGAGWRVARCSSRRWAAGGCRCGARARPRPAGPPSGRDPRPRRPPRSGPCGAGWRA